MVPSRVKCSRKLPVEETEDDNLRSNKCGYIFTSVSMIVPVPTTTNQHDPLPIMVRRGARSTCLQDESIYTHRSNLSNRWCVSQMVNRRNVPTTTTLCLDGSEKKQYPNTHGQSYVLAVTSICLPPSHRFRFALLRFDSLYG